VQIYQSSLPELHPDRLQAESLLAESLFYQGRIEEAAPLLEKGFFAKQKVFGNKSSRVAEDLQLLMELRRRQGRLVEAEKLARETVALKQERLGESNYNTAYSKTSLATILWQRGKFSEAESELRAALIVYRENLPIGNLLTASAEHYLAEVLLSQKRLIEAATQAKLTLEHLSITDATPWRIARTENTLGQALFELHKIPEAQAYLERSYKLLSTAQGVDVEAASRARARLAAFYTATNDQAKLAALRAAPTALSSIRAPMH
jgi:tetratricopeptide (TPR) repeat protein